MGMTFYFKLTEVSSKLPCWGNVGNLTLNTSPRNRSPFIYSENVYSFYDGALWMDLHYVVYNTATCHTWWCKLFIFQASNNRFGGGGVWSSCHGPDRVLLLMRVLRSPTKFFKFLAVTVLAGVLIIQVLIQSAYTCFNIKFWGFCRGKGKLYSQLSEERASIRI